MKISKFLLTIGAFLLLAVIISACSIQVQNEEKVANTTVIKVPSTAHTHPANECTNSITHSHPLPSGSKVHKHSYSCKGKVPKSINTHRHPANKCTRSTTHTHPNGRRSHSHKYACQAKSGSRGNTHAVVGARGNAHVHAANNLTRSMRHVHPGGNRKHTHHYGR